MPADARTGEPPRNRSDAEWTGSPHARAGSRASCFHNMIGLLINIATPALVPPYSVSGIVCDNEADQPAHADDRITLQKLPA